MINWYLVYCGNIVKFYYVHWKTLLIKEKKLLFELKFIQFVQYCEILF